MPIMLPLTLLGIGYLIYLLFAGATFALPIALAAAAGFGASRLGCSPMVAILLAAIAFVAVVATSRFAALSLANPQARMALAIVCAVPAALAGYSCGQGLGSLIGIGGVVAGLVAGCACAAVAAHRMLRPVI